MRKKDSIVNKFKFFHVLFIWYKLIDDGGDSQNDNTSVKMLWKKITFKVSYFSFSGGIYESFF